mmetsp:Transcript_6531/g.23473  ORF Transcript_6531/g.23473 Transcript_6531/m.23473 type:complete len:208 (+) Transcript_6531:3230-3853(+)
MSISSVVGSAKRFVVSPPSASFTFLSTSRVSPGTVSSVSVGIGLVVWFSVASSLEGRGSVLGFSHSSSSWTRSARPGSDPVTSPVRVIPTVSSSCRFITTLTPPSKVSVSRESMSAGCCSSCSCSCGVCSSSISLLLTSGTSSTETAESADLRLTPALDMLLSEPEGDCSAENMLVVSNPKTDFALLFLLLTSASPSSSLKCSWSLS